MAPRCWWQTKGVVLTPSTRSVWRTARWCGLLAVLARVRGRLPQQTRAGADTAPRLPRFCWRRSVPDASLGLLGYVSPARACAIMIVAASMSGSAALAACWCPTPASLALVLHAIVSLARHFICAGRFTLSRAACPKYGSAAASRWGTAFPRRLGRIVPAAGGQGVPRLAGRQRNVNGRWCH
jgi:hypothetical protein